MKKQQQQREFSNNGAFTAAANGEATVKARINFVDRNVERVSPARGVDATERLYADSAYDKKIRDRAYEIYLTRQQGYGSAEDDWFEAERELVSDTQR